MKSRLLLLVVGLLLPAAVPAQPTVPDDPGVAPATEAPPPSIADNPLTAAAAAAAVCAPVPPGAVAWWRAESDTVDTIGVNDALFDLARFQAALYMPGKVGTAFRFLSYPIVPGGTNFFFVPPSPDLDVGGGDGLTIEGWLSPDAVTGLQPVVEWNDGQGNIGAGLALNGSALEASLSDTNTSPWRRIVLRSTTGTFGTSVWHHVALTFDKAAGQAIAYVDGLAVAQTNLGTFRPATRAPVQLGSRPSGTNAGTYYHGGLDELTIYNRALTVAEIQSIVAAGAAGKCVPPPPLPVPPPAGFVGWWRGESNTVDSVDSNNGILSNTVHYQNGEVGKAFQFDTGYVRIPAASNLDLGVGPGFTIETWVWPEFSGDPFVSGSREFVGWHSGTVTQGVSLAIAHISRPSPFPPFPSSSLVWEANLVDTQRRSHVIRSPADLATIELWQHVALTYDKASGLAVLYFNGNPVTQTNLGLLTPQTAADLNLGYQPAGWLDPPFPTFPNGALDEVSLYARALSPADIRAIMLARGTGKSRQPPLIVSNPAGIRANLGATATFAVTASGNPILKYQWRRNGVALPGATGSTLIVTYLQVAQAGAYSVRITNAFGVALSSDALLTVNLPPVADASATQPLVIAPLHCDATVVLDGSRSSDPDGDPLHFSWFQAGVAAPLATGMVAVVSLPPGVNPLLLVVDDGLATNSQSFTVQVLTLADAVERLIALVNLQAPEPQPLVASLSAALAAINRDAPTPAINQLAAFQNKTLAQVAPSDPALAQTFIRTAQQLAAILSADCSSARPPAPVARVRHQDGGTLRLGFNAPQGFVYIVEASTNLVDWEKIGVPADCGFGEFEFEDRHASQLPTRFYRLVVP